MPAVKISSANPAAELTFSDLEGSYYVVSFKGRAIQLAVKVYAIEGTGFKDTASLVKLFETMANNWKGWKGKLTWESLEGEMKIVAKSDSRGHAILDLTFQDFLGQTPWSADVELTLETMQVEQAYRHLAKFFSKQIK